MNLNVFSDEERTVSSSLESNGPLVPVRRGMFTECYTMIWLLVRVQRSTVSLFMTGKRPFFLQ